MAKQDSEKQLLSKYLDDSSKTLSGKFFYDEKNSNEPDVYHFSKLAIKATEELDLVKKKKFYGKAVNISSSAPEDIRFDRDEKGENLLHAAIGIVTESGEILDTILKYKYGQKELDVVNIKEELGDVMWYMAILFRDLDIDLYEALDTNIAKLRSRYGEKFSAEKAINRNLTTERQILEGGVVVTENRSLETGGMKPPKNKWTSYATVDITEAEKKRIKEEMARKLGLVDEVIVKDDGSLKLEDVGAAFAHFEHYEGSFIIKLLASKEEILDKATDINEVDLSSYMKKLQKVEKIALSVYDFVSKPPTQQRFIIIIDFDQMTGVLKLDKVLGPKNEIYKLSITQQIELDNFLSTNGIEK